jgi:GNAT superfamily N-acetyltransferase
MWWRLKRSEFAESTGRRNKRMMKRIVDSGEVPGILAYADRNPVGWCSVALREAYPALERSWVLKKVDDKPVWSVVCFFIARTFRRRGLMSSLLGAAIEYAKEYGAEIVEGYPVQVRGRHMSGSEGFTGLVPAFKEAGFTEVLRRSPGRPIMRYSIPSA